jgi:hypothetical protein
MSTPDAQVAVRSRRVSERPEKIYNRSTQDVRFFAPLTAVGYNLRAWIGLGA